MSRHLRRIWEWVVEILKWDKKQVYIDITTTSTSDTQTEKNGKGKQEYGDKDREQNEERLISLTTQRTGEKAQLKQYGRPGIAPTLEV